MMRYGSRDALATPPERLAYVLCMWPARPGLMGVLLYVSTLVPAQGVPLRPGSGPGSYIHTLGPAPARTACIWSGP